MGKGMSRAGHRYAGGTKKRGEITVWAQGHHIDFGREIGLFMEVKRRRSRNRAAYWRPWQRRTGQARLMIHPWTRSLLALLSAGCAAVMPPQENDGPAEKLAVLPPASSDAPSIGETPDQAPVPVVRPETPPEPAATPRMRPRPVSRTAEELMGLTPEQIERLLGPPNLVRQDMPAITWRYSEEACNLDFKFYQDIESGLFRALKYEAEGASADGCLARIERRGEP